MTNPSLVLAALLIFLTNFIQAQGNLVVNGSFEAGTNGWTVQMNAPVQGPGFLIALSGNGLPSNFPDGNHIGFFTERGGSVSQTLNTTPGVYYTLMFSAIQFDGVNDASVSINGSLLSAIAYQNYTFFSPVQTSFDSSYNSIWENFIFSFQATSGTTTLSFAELPNRYVTTDNTSYWSKGGLDNISVTAIPEPSSLVLLGLGLAGLFIRRRPTS